MARIAAVDLPSNKRIEIALMSIYGIGRSKSREILKHNNISFDIKANDLTETQIISLRNYIEHNVRVEGDLRSEIFLNIKRLMDISCYRGLRHRKNMPVHGQRTRTNAKTRKSRKQKPFRGVK